MFQRIETLGDVHTHPAEGVKTLPQLKAIIIHSLHVPSIDGSALHIFFHMIEDYHKRNIFMCFVSLKKSIEILFSRTELDKLGGKRFFPDIDTAVQYAKDIQIEEEKLVFPIVVDEEL